MGSFAKYSLLRFGLLLAVLAVLALIGARGWLLLLLTVVISAGLSYLLLRRQRDEVTRDLLERRRTGLDRRIARDNAAEDADAEYGGGSAGADSSGGDCSGGD